MISTIVVGVLLGLALMLLIDWLIGQRKLSGLRDEGHANQRREGNRVLWWRVVGTDRLYRTEAEALRAVLLDLERIQRERPNIVHLALPVMPWWVWDDKDPFWDPFPRGAAPWAPWMAPTADPEEHA